MITHHAQAVQMADTVRQKTQNDEIRALATDIVLTQQGEIGQMRGWLEEWGLSNSVGHYLDLWSAVLGLTLFCVGYLCNVFTKRQG
jgi:hypothetical protein